MEESRGGVGNRPDLELGVVLGVGSSCIEETYESCMLNRLRLEGPWSLRLVSGGMGGGTCGNLKLWTVWPGSNG
jgi:hypothetical protein